MARQALVFGAVALIAVVLIAPPALASITIDFDDNPVGGGPIAKDRYAALGVRMSLLTATGLFSDKQLTATSGDGLPAPAGGRGIVPYANLAGFLDDFVFDFTTPITSFSLYAFVGDQAVRAEGYRAGVLISEFGVPSEPRREMAELSLGAPGGPLQFDRVIMRPTLRTAADPTLLEGPKYYDLLTFDPVPAPGTAWLVAPGVMVAARRRR